MLSVRRARIEVLLAGLLFSTGGVSMKAISLSGWQVASFRAGVAAVVLLVLVPASRSTSPRAIALGTIQAATFVTFVIANKLTTAAHAVFLQALAPLWLVLLAPLLLGERVHKREIPFLSVLIAGSALLLWKAPPTSATAPHTLAGNVVGAVSGLMWALTLAGLRWAGRRAAGDFSAASMTMWGCVFAFVVCLPLALPVQGARPLDWTLIVYLGIFQVGLAYVFLTRAIGRVRAVEASVLLLAEPALSPLWAWLVHGESPGALALVGGAIILVATTWHSVSSRPS